jgi:ABC-type transport system involved in cytochrome c biogenesis ATPase subunit
VPRPLADEAVKPFEGPPALRAEGLRLADEDGQSYGPLDLTVRPGEAALVVVRELEVLRRLMKCCLAFERPDSGRISWRLGAGHDGPGSGAFFRRIGYVDRQSQLLHRWSLLDHFQIFESYSGAPGEPGAAGDLLETLGLAAQAGTPTENLPEPLRRLALYALALYQRPRLMLLERPFQFLDQDFRLVWGLIRGRAAAGKLAVVVFDRTRDVYPPGSFRHTAVFTPADSG